MAFQTISSSAGSTAALRRFTPEGQPAWRKCSNEFGSMLPDGPTLALTRTHVALQEKTVELEFVQGAFQRAQVAWQKEKADLVEEVRTLRAEKMQLERQTNNLQVAGDEQRQAANLAADGAAREREKLLASHRQEMSELSGSLKAVTAEAQFLESRARVLKAELQEKQGCVTREEFSQMSLAAEERIREIEAKTAHEIQTVWHDRANLLNHNTELQATVRQLQAALEEERRIRAAHVSHSQILAEDKRRLGDTLERVAERNTNLQVELQRNNTALASAKPRSRSASPAKRPASGSTKRSSKTNNMWR